MTILAVFVCQFCAIFLRGTQTLNVTRNHCWRAAFCSLLLGLCGLFLTGSIAITAVRDGMGGLPVYLAFLAAGPCGIVTSMLIGNRK